MTAPTTIIDRTSRQGRTGYGFAPKAAATHDPSGCDDDGFRGTETVVGRDWYRTLTTTTTAPRR